MVSTALIYEIIVAERLELARVVVASSQAAMGEGLYLCPVDGEQLPGHAPRGGRWPARSGTSPARSAAGRLRCRPTPERVSNPQNAYGMSKLGEEMVAVNLGRRYGIPTVALRYSIVQGPRQSVYNAYSGACRIFCLHYLQGLCATLYEDGEAIRDYVNIDDVVDANMLGAGGRPGRRAGLQRRRRQAGHDPGVRRHGHAPVRFRPAGHGRPASSASATPATSCPTSSALRGAGLDPAAHRPRIGSGLRRVAGGDAAASTAITGRRQRPACGPARAAQSGQPGGQPVKAFLLARRAGHPAAADHQHHPKCMLPIDGRPLLDIWLDALDRAGR